MTKTQILILLLALIPLASALAVKLFADFPAIIDISTKAFPVLFLVNIIGIYGNLGHDLSTITLIKFSPAISFAFEANILTLFFLFLLSFLWIILACHAQYIFQNDVSKNINSFRIFLSLIIAAISFIVISKNIFTTLFFYNALIVLGHFFAIAFLHKGESKFSRLFTFLLYCESFLLFLAIVATYKFSGQIDFNDNGIVADISNNKQRILLMLYLGGLFLSVIFPCYLFYRNINLNPLVLYLLFFLSYAFSSIYILLKILGQIFGSKTLMALLSGSGFAFFESIFLFNIAAISIFLIFNNGLKSSFFYLFFHQFSFALFSIFIFSIFAPYKAHFAVISFVLGLSLAFLCISNAAIYLSKATDKSNIGLFFNLKITISLLIFAIANMVGIVPGVGIVEKFFIAKIIFKEKLYLSGVILLVNILSLIAFAVKSFYPFFLKQDEEEQDEEDLSLSENIEHDSASILTTVTVALAVLLAPILLFFIPNL